MDKSRKLLMLWAVTAALPVWGEETAVAGKPAAPRPSFSIYRQITPDGKVSYTDAAPEGSKIDKTITFEAPIKGNLWSAEPVETPAPKRAAPAIPVPIVKKMATPIQTTFTLKPVLAPAESLNLDVMRAEMLLEEARQRQSAGLAPLASELRDDGHSVNEAYASRQKMLARDVAYAEDQLKKAKATRP